MNTVTNKQGILFIVSAPSGAGKTTLIKSLVDDDPNLMVSISYTTRSSRADEIQDKSYHFVNRNTFEKLVQEDKFLEHALVFNHRYGTPKDWVEQKLKAGIDIVLEIDWQGAQQVSQSLSNTVSLFILPPSFHALEDRLKGRGEEETIINQRMVDAENQISHYREYDYLMDST